MENDAGTRKLLDVLLTRSGVEVDLAPSGNDALILLENAEYDLVLVDLFLPGTNGMQVLEGIARERPSQLTKSVVLSSAPEWQLQRVRDQWPQVRVIRKPFDLAEILELAQAIAVEGEERVPSFAETFCRRSVRLGARAGLIVVKTDAQIEAVHSFGYGSGEVESYFPLPLESAVPLCAAIRNATPVWLASVTLATADYPLLQPDFARNESRAVAVVPLLHDEGVIGAVGWSFREPRLFTDSDQQALLAIAASLAGSLPERAGRSTTAAGA